MKFVIDRDETFEFPTDAEISSAAQSLLSLESVIVPTGIIEVLLCGDQEITQLNRDFRSEDSSTDVLAFEMLEEDPETSELIVGSIAVNCDLAYNKASNFVAFQDNKKLDKRNIAAGETLLYILHGILHFAGYDDDTPEDRREMFEIASAVLVKLGYKSIPYDFELEV